MSSPLCQAAPWLECPPPGGSSPPPAFSGHPRDDAQAHTALNLDLPEGVLGASFGGPLVTVGLLPTRKQLLWLQGPWCPGSWSADVCVCFRILHASKCQGKSEGKRFHPPPALNGIIASKSGCLTRMLQLTWGGGRCIPPSQHSHRGQAGEDLFPHVPATSWG